MVSVNNQIDMNLIKSRKLTVKNPKTNDKHKHKSVSTTEQMNALEMFEFDGISNTYVWISSST